MPTTSLLVIKIEWRLTMTIDSIEVVFYTCVFLLPGFIIKSIMDTLVPPPRHNDAKYFFSCLFYSIVNCAVWSWAYISINTLSENHPIIYWLLILTITVLGSSLVAILISVIKQKGIIEWIFSRIKISKIHPVPTAWDYFFSKQQASWIIVTLKSGKSIYGIFSTRSYASSDPEERDIYIEKTYVLKDDMTWEEDEKSNGILISKDEIETIEFLT